VWSGIKRSRRPARPFGPPAPTTLPKAIMTSDTRPNKSPVEFELGGKKARIGGLCQRRGMIQPGMSATGWRPAALPLHATMLCFLTTDAAIEATALQAALQEAVAKSFNRITVDGDMSTNDTVLVLANGRAGNSRFTIHGSRFTIFQSALKPRLPRTREDDRARWRRRHRVVTVRVNGAKVRCRCRPPPPAPWPTARW